MWNSPTNRTIVSQLYKDPTDTGRTCVLCEHFIAQSRKAGYEAVVRRCLRDNRAVTIDLFVDKVATSTRAWMKLVSCKNIPFRLVDDTYFRQCIKHQPIGFKCLKKRMRAAIDLMEPLIIEELADENYVLMLDGLTASSEHALAVFIVTRKGVRFLAISTFLDESAMTADEHIRFLDLILNQYHLKSERLIAMVCDNMETNKSISRKSKAPMIGCAAHRLNLAVRLHVKNLMPLVRKVSVLMAKLKTVKRWALLKKNGCKLRPIVLHEIRWTGIYRVVKRYIELRKYLHLFESDIAVDREIEDDVPAEDPRRKPICDYIPTPREHAQLEKAVVDLGIFEECSTTLQRNGITGATENLL